MKEKNMKCSVILLAGGSGKRMHSDIPKQFMEVAGRPLIWYSLDCVERSEAVDECILVTAEDDMQYMKEEILAQNYFSKVRAVVCGGRERFESVLNGVNALKKLDEQDEQGHVVMIHDGARPLLTHEVLEACLKGAVEHRACVAAVPSKDTVAMADEAGFEVQVPDRRYVWNVQTPQAFLAQELYGAFGELEKELEEPGGLERLSWITDDACVVEHYNGTRIRLIRGDYRNIKVTTPEDLRVVEEFLKL